MGNEFEKRRLDLGKDIKNVAGLTRIKESYLLAIEKDDFKELPVEVYTKGYIREYAKFLGIPSEGPIANYDRYLEDKKGPKKKEQSEVLPDDKNKPAVLSGNADNNRPQATESLKTNGSSEVYHNDNIAIALTTTSSRNLFSQKILFIVPLIFGALLGYLYITPQEEKPSQTQKTEASIPVQPQIQQPAPVPEQPVPTVAVNPVQPIVPPQTQPVIPQTATKTVIADNLSAKQNAIPAKKKKHNLDITAVDTVWLKVIRDGVEKNETLLKAGEHLNYGADQSFAVTVGNAAGIKLTFNGRVMENLGEKGQVIMLNLPESPSKKTDSGNKKEAGEKTPASPLPPKPQQP